MAIARRLRNALYALLLIGGILLWLVALLLFAQVAENSDDFARFQHWVLLINSLGIGILFVLIVANLVRLVRDYRRQVPGSRLKARMVGLLVILAITPLVVVYIFSVEFINRGIDDWFNVDVERGLADALELSQTALDQQTRDNRELTVAMAENLADVPRDELLMRLGPLLETSRAAELTVFGADDRIIATRSADPSADVPGYLSEEVGFQLRRGEAYVSLEPLSDGGYEIVAAAPVPSESQGAERRFLRATFPVAPRISALANSVQVSYNQFSELTFMRTALKTSFTLTLSLVLLISMLASVYGAFFAARRLVVPIQRLMQATRAVARGDFDTRLPTAAKDEIGFLINSFNDMTQRLAGARQEARNSEQQVEAERRKLEIILARLSTGVVSLEPDLAIRTANQAAGAILGVDLEADIGRPLSEVASRHPVLEPFFRAAETHLQRGETEWREQIALSAEAGRRVLMCACTGLPAEGGDAGGYVIVFDDITTLLQAQREAAWGEVARRLAHEIKNPLTPIQLSAERMRRRYLSGEVGDAELLDRATHTIIQQVDAMKEMVNAFSQYARSPEMELERVDLNELVAEVSEMYRQAEAPVTIACSLHSSAAEIDADPGRIRQVLHNLMRNALEAVEQQAAPRVDVSTRSTSNSKGEWIEIRVADNGPGFSSDLLHQAFDPYVTSKAKGTGLGLAIVKKLVEEHGGVIHAANAERGGAEISILLPKAAHGRQGAAAGGGEQRRERA